MAQCQLVLAGDFVDRSDGRGAKALGLATAGDDPGRLLPRPAKVSARYCRAPSPSETSRMTLSTPISTPSVVRNARILLARSVSMAVRSSSRKGTSRGHGREARRGAVPSKTA